MNTNYPVPLRDLKQKQDFLVEVANSEKQLWAVIYSKGLLQIDVQDLYLKVRSSYEKIILDDHELSELQDVEYSLWKLHYKHIDEFRKRIKKSSAEAEISKLAMPQNAANVQKSNNKHTEGFKLFLLEATEFYQNLIDKIRKYYGLPEESLFCEKGGISDSVEPKKMQKCQFLCYRSLVCLGDLARYRELYEKSDVQNRNWSVAATHYFKAIMFWPDSGNPHNQLALLATYVGDEFLALYHCIRSLAVKEPFPDAWDNLSLLFEKNRSSQFKSLSCDAQFDFLKPSERSSFQSKSQSRVDFSNSNTMKAEHDCSMETNLWSHIIRMISFFFMKSSLVDIPCAFASTMTELEALMAVDEAKLKATLESYQVLSLARTGPFRALQVVSVFIFITQNLIQSPEIKGSEDKKDIQQLLLTQLALTVTFIFMGRFVERCLKASPLDTSPFLPAVLVFVEWLVSVLDKAETYGVDEKSTKAMSYFFGAFIDLLNHLHVNPGEVKSPDTNALWEDYELRGFAPVGHAHNSLDFLSKWEHKNTIESENEYRAHRIIKAAMKIANRSNYTQRWISYDKFGSKFYATVSNEVPTRGESETADTSSSDLKVKEPHQQICEATTECEKQICVQGKSVAEEEEEVILFKPLSRYNSAPLHNSFNINGQMHQQDRGYHAAPSDESLRRATSLLMQNQSQSTPFTFHCDTFEFRHNQPFKQQEDILGHPFSEPTISAGPPSLSAWVLNRGSLSIDRQREAHDVGKHGLRPIEEIGSASLESLAGLSICQTEDSAVVSGQESLTTHIPSLSYSTPVPSAPLLPDDAVYYGGNPPSFSKFKRSEVVNKTHNFSDASQLSGLSNWTSTHWPLDYNLGFPAPFRGVSSSEWLRQYRENHNLDRANNQAWPSTFHASGNLTNLPSPDASRFAFFDQWGNPLADNSMTYFESPPLLPGFPSLYGVEEQRREKLFHVYQRPVPNGCFPVTDSRHEQQPLLQYLKEKEWRLQQDPNLRGPTYMGN